MKVYDVGLIGRGKMGKAFQTEIEKSNKFNLVKTYDLLFKIEKDIEKKNYKLIFINS